MFRLIFNDLFSFRVSTKSVFNCEFYVTRMHHTTIHHTIPNGLAKKKRGKNASTTLHNNYNNPAESLMKSNKKESVRTVSQHPSPHPWRKLMNVLQFKHYKLKAVCMTISRSQYYSLSTNGA